MCRLLFVASASWLIGVATAASIVAAAGSSSIVIIYVVLSGVQARSRVAGCVCWRIIIVQALWVERVAAA